MLLAYLSTDTIVATFSTIPAFCVNWILFMGNRWMRLTPMVMAVAWAIVSILPLASNGWDYSWAQGAQRACEGNLQYSFFYLDAWLHLGCKRGKNGASRLTVARMMHLTVFYNLVITLYSLFI